MDGLLLVAVAVQTGVTAFAAGKLWQKVSDLGRRVTSLESIITRLVAAALSSRTQ
jgi:hypothetical protein